MKIPRNIPGVLVSNVSFPKVFEKEISSGEKIPELMLPYLIKSIKQLEKAGADFIVLPCNTLHSLLPKLKENSNLEILDLIESVSDEIRKMNLEKIGILCTSQTRKEKLYDNSLKNTEIIYPSEEEQKELSEIIIRIIRKESDEEDKRYLENLTSKLLEKGAERVILACTDLGNLMEKKKNVMDSTQILINYVKKRNI